MEAISRWFHHLRARPESDAEREAQEERTRAVVEKLAHAIVARRMEAPATLFLELNRPMGFIFSQATYFLSPFLRMVLAPEDIEAAADILDDPRAIDMVLDRIHELSAQETASG